VQDTSAEAMRTGTVQQPLTGQDFVEHLGPDQGIRAYDAYRQNLQLGTDIASVATMSPAEQVALMKKYDPQPGEGFFRPDQAPGRAAHGDRPRAKGKPEGRRRLRARRLPAVKDAYTKFVQAQGGNDPAAAQSRQPATSSTSRSPNRARRHSAREAQHLPAAVANSILTGITKRTSNAVAREGQSSFDLAANIKGQANSGARELAAGLQADRKEAGPLPARHRLRNPAQAAPNSPNSTASPRSRSSKTRDAEKPAEVKKQVVEAFSPSPQRSSGAQDRLSLLDSFRGQGEKLAADYVVNAWARPMPPRRPSTICLATV